MGHMARLNLWDTATSVASTAVLTSSAIKMDEMEGNGAAVRVVIAGTSPSIALTMTVSDTRNGEFVTPYDTDGTSLGDVAAVGSELTTTRWVYFNPPLAKYIKFVVTGSSTNSADTTVKAHLIMQEG